MGYTQEQLKDYNKQYSKDSLDKAIQMHKEFLSKFPKDKLSWMTLDEYSLGRAKTGSFCWWLEFNSLVLGSIKGGNAGKLIIYYSPKDAEWKYPKEDFKSVDDAWEKLRSDIIELIDCYEKRPYGEINEDNLLVRANMLKGKILYLYHPDKFLPIYKVEHIQNCLEHLDVPKKLWEGKNNIECNLILKDTISKINDMKNIDPVIIKDFFYKKIIAEEKYYKIAPGENAAYWQECKEGGYISLGWNEIGDLRNYPDYEEFKSAFHKLKFQKTAGKNTEKANEMWTFYNMNSGDVVLANNGKSEILGIGKVADKGYEFRSDLNTQQHVVYIEWDKNFKAPLSIPAQNYWAMKTVVEVSKKEYIEWTTKKPDSSSGYTTDEERFFERLENVLYRKGQGILYGPPGTGKTYLARKFVEWKNEKDTLLGSANRKILKIWMMIAIPGKFEWESILKNGGNISFDLKRIEKNFKAAKKGDRVLCYKGGNDRGFVGIGEIEREFDSKVIYVKGIRQFKTPISFDDIKDCREYQTSQAGRINNRGTMFEVNEDFAYLIKDILLEMDDVDSAQLISDVTEKNNFEMCTFHPSFNYEDFIEGYKPIPTDKGSASFALEKGVFARLCAKAESNPDISYYILIDEINRGNIPKIFGEIITLLEKDKREVDVILPQSKEYFNVPRNLYIIGTMNTSDRSIKIMDAALKRRFAFIECMPRTELIDTEIDNLGKSPGYILGRINEKLVSFGGRDKQIGHSYFMKEGKQITSVDELKEIYEMEIIPLVQEYCFDDYSQLADIIGSGFVDVENMEINYSIFQEPNDVFISELTKAFKD